MEDEVWAEVTPPKCPGCRTRFPRLLTLKVSTEGQYQIRLECPTCLYEMDWLFSQEGIADQWVEELLDLQDERYGNSVGDFAAWDDELLEESDPEAGIQLEFPDMWRW